MAENIVVLEFRTSKEWIGWLAKNHAVSTGEWVRLAKKGCSRPMLGYKEALEAALCQGWIDAQTRGESETAWLKRFTPRGKKSIWSKINCAHALRLIEAGRMEPAGLEEVERAKADGRWAAAYDGPRTATVPEDLAAALAGASGEARAFFGELKSNNRYAILWRIQTTKTATTRAKRIGQMIEMLERKETFHP